MFARKDRLSRAAFGGAAMGKRRAATPHFSLTASSDAKGVAVVVSKKVAKRSVDRHLVKRRVAAALRTLKLPPALIVYARKGAVALPYRLLQGELEAALAEIARTS